MKKAGGKNFDQKDASRKDLDRKEGNRRLPDTELEVMQALWQADHPLLRSELDQVPGQKNGWAPQVLVTMLICTLIPLTRSGDWESKRIRDL